MTLEQLAKTLYLALKNSKPCACPHHWKDGHFVKASLCAGCQAIEAYESSRLVTMDIKT